MAHTGDPHVWRALLRDHASALSIIFRSGPRGVVVKVSSDGAVVARSDGAPQYHFGRRLNTLSQTVPVWRFREPEMHAVVVAGLVDAGFPNVDGPEDMHMLVPDEIPSRLIAAEPLGSTAQLEVTSRMRTGVAGIGAVVGAFDAICVRTQRAPSTDTMPNPEFRQWPAEDRAWFPKRPWRNEPPSGRSSAWTRPTSSQRSRRKYPNPNPNPNPNPLITTVFLI